MSNLKVAIIGGSWFGVTHSRAARLAGNRIECGAFGSSPESSAEYAQKAEWQGVESFESWRGILEMKAKYQRDKFDYVVIATPNNCHFEQAMTFVEMGIPVLCEKPMTMTVEEALQLVAAVGRKTIPFCVAYTYTGHWTLRLARHLVRNNYIGGVRWVEAKYLQGWLAHPIERKGQKQAAWRTDPARSGASCCGGDIGTHALEAIRFVTGIEPRIVHADMETFVDGRVLDDHFVAYLKLGDHASGLIHASQVHIGHKNDHRLEVVGRVGSIQWAQEDSEKLIICDNNGSETVLYRGVVSKEMIPDIPDDLLAESTLPGGHGEAFHDALARLHRCFSADVIAYQRGEFFGQDKSAYPTVDTGFAGVRFIHDAVAMSNATKALRLKA